MARRSMTEEVEEALVKFTAAYLRMRDAAPTGRGFEKHAADWDRTGETLARRAIAAGYGPEGA